MKDRYVNTEYLGVTKVQSIMFEDFNWIFRVQANPDVGIDAQFEIVEDGIPTAQFGAIQIKKGNSHFYKSKLRNRFTYYASKEHFDYWTQSSIPVFIIGVLDDNSVIWQYASDAKRYAIKNESYALKIPSSNILDLKAKSAFQELVYTHLNLFDVQHKLTDKLKDITDFNQEMDYLFQDMNESISQISSHLDVYTKRTNVIAEKGTNALGSNFGNRQNQRTVLIEKYRVQINMLSNRMKTEIVIFESSISGISNLFLKTDELSSVDKLVQSIVYIPPFEKLISGFDAAIESMLLTKKSIQDHASYNSLFKTAKINSNAVFKNLIETLTNIKTVLNKEITTYNKKYTAFGR